MGKEFNCTAHSERQTSAGQLRLETDDLIFRGEFRLRIPLKQIKSATVNDGQLTVSHAEGAARFELGAAASKWADAINHPKSLLDKLGVKSGMNVSVIGVSDDAFLDDLNARIGQVTSGKVARASDLIFFQVDEPKGLSSLQSLVPVLKAAGAIWVITPKRRPELADTVVMAAGKAAGLVDVKVARFSESHTALKFVIPKAKR
jgi:hypothetical protein